MTGRVAAIKPDPADLTPLRIDEALVDKMLVSFLRDETAKAGLGRVVVGVSGGVDSAVVATLAAAAFGPSRVTALFTPYRTSDPRSLEDAELVARTFGLSLEVVPITAQIDAYANSAGEGIHRVRLGNKMARERKSIEYDRSWPDGLVLGTSNKTELLLGYGTQFGDMACALNPVGDLYKTQLRELAVHLGVPKRIVEKPPSADLWSGQTDEEELGFGYAEADLVLYHLVDRRLRPADLIACGFDAGLVTRIREMVRKSHFKRVMPLIAKLSLRTVGHDFLYPRDWEADPSG
ncbi:MAG TPA: NAD+ synthase [Candidatus Limnocylindria bacterium]|nr:NAD+ synthase [Candidatus Limnocylindria bacterium]